MGYYTEFKLKALLNGNPPQDVLDSMINGDLIDKLFIDKFGVMPNIMSVSSKPDLPIEHPYGTVDRWDQMFHNVTLKDNELIMKCEIKAYNDIYDKFMDWINPCISHATLKTRGEECEDWTTTIITNF